MMKTKFYGYKSKLNNESIDPDSPLIPLAVLVATHSPKVILSAANKILYPAKKEKKQVGDWDTYYDFLSYPIPSDEEFMALCTPPVEDFSDLLL